jgi:hypothetical protein
MVDPTADAGADDGNDDAEAAGHAVIRIDESPPDPELDDPDDDCAEGADETTPPPALTDGDPRFVPEPPNP